MKRDAVLHPLLFGVFPVLFLYAQNAGEMRATQVIGPLIVVLVATATLFFLMTKVFGDRHKCGVVVSALVLLFFSNGVVLKIMEPYFRQTLARRNQVIVLFVLVAAMWLVIKGVKSLGDRVEPLTPLLNFVAAGLVLLQVFTVGASVLARQELRLQGSGQAVAGGAVTARPDIFFILLDGYGRHDVLQDLYHHDNLVFLSALESRGFQVGYDSRAPYVQTLLTLAAIFNLDYLDRMAELDPDSTDRVGLSESIWNGEAVDSMRALGYSTVSFATGYKMTEFRSADRYIEPRGLVGDFGRLILSTTPLEILKLGTEAYSVMHRKRIDSIFERLGTLGGDEKPVFVLAHAVSPHPPFVLGVSKEEFEDYRLHGLSDGNHRIRSSEDRDFYIEKYRQQVEEVNALVTQSVDELLARPEAERPVVVIASDHGPGSGLMWGDMKTTNLRERVGSLFAIYLPDGAEALPEPMSPINTFRLIFNRYFGTDYPLLPSRSFYSTHERPFRFHEVDESELGLTSPSQGG